MPSGRTASTLRRRLRLWLGLPTLILATPILGFLGWKEWDGNFATVVPGEVYRSGQMGPNLLGKKVRAYGIRTVINLRGSHPESPWYRAERAETLAAGATQLDIALSSCDWMSRDQARVLIDALETAERPVLVHCWRGSERTGMANAFLALLRPGSTLDDARGQFSFRYLFLPIGDGITSLRHFEAYEAWLKSNRLAHNPEQFRSWIRDHYRPGTPSRQIWDYDPYPLVVETRPAATSGVARTVPVERR